MINGLNEDIFMNSTDGIRVLYLINRENQNTNRQSSRWVKKSISTDSIEYMIAFESLLSIMKKPERIYASVNKRNFRKATKIFKQKMLDNEYMTEEQNFNFHKNIYNNWISSLASPESREESNFLVDYDSKDYISNEIKNIIEPFLIYSYPTENGFHFITRPFNPIFVDKYPLEIKKDALLLLAW